MSTEPSSKKQKWLDPDELAFHQLVEECIAMHKALRNIDDATFRLGVTCADIEIPPLQRISKFMKELAVKLDKVAEARMNKQEFRSYFPSKQ
jgi:hypothetical protein